MTNTNQFLVEEVSKEIRCKSRYIKLTYHSAKIMKEFAIFYLKFVGSEESQFET